MPRLFETPDVLLQFLYDQNVICYFEVDEDGNGKKFIRWCFRERSPANPSPKVRTNTEYEIFYGLTKALNVGRRIKLQPKEKIREVGSIVNINHKKRFGFIRRGAGHKDYFFTFRTCRRGFG